MAGKEASNIIIKLMQEGWDGDKINEFILFIGTHDPAEEEARASLDRNRRSVGK